MSTLNLWFVLLGLMLITYETSAIKCWRCASDISNSEFCGERLDQSALTRQQRDWNYIECSPPKEPKNLYGEKMVSKCRIQLQSVNGRKVYSRHCVAEAENAERNACLARSVLPQVEVLACETCQGDGCNENFSEKPDEMKVNDDNSAGIKTLCSLQVLSVAFGFAWLLF